MFYKIYEGRDDDSCLVVFYYFREWFALDFKQFEVEELVVFALLAVFIVFMFCMVMFEGCCEGEEFTVFFSGHRGLVTLF